MINCYAYYLLQSVPNKSMIIPSIQNYSPLARDENNQSSLAKTSPLLNKQKRFGKRYGLKIYPM